MTFIPFLICWYLVGMLSFFLLQSLTGKKAKWDDIFAIFFLGGLFGVFSFLMVFISLFAVFVYAAWDYFKWTRTLKKI